MRPTIHPVSPAGRPSPAVSTDRRGSTGRRARLQQSVLAGVVALGTLALPAAAQAAIANDGPQGAVPFLSGEAENGRVTDLQRTVVLDGATPDAAAPRCLGPQSFERTAWLSIGAADKPRRLSIEAAAKDASTATPDLAAYVQPGRTGADVREPQGCSGRETAGDAARGDLGASVVLAVPAGSSVLVQVGWRGADAAVPVVASLAASTLPTAPSPAGQAFRTAPFAPLGKGLAAVLTGATTTALDPAQPRCASQAGVWRRVRIARRGVYAASVAGDAADALTVYRSSPTGDSAAACADDGTSPALTSVFRASRTGTYWLRVGTDTPEKASRAGLAIVGPYATAKAGRAAAPAAFDRAARVLDPRATCTDRRAPRPAVDASALRALRGGGRVVRGTNDGARCANGRSTVRRITVAVARITGGRCAWRTGRTFGAPRSCSVPRGARSVALRADQTWRATLPAALPRGERYRVVVRAQVRSGGKTRDRGPRVVLAVRR